MRSSLEFELADGINAIVGDYYIGRTDYSCTGEWRCTGGDIILIDNRNGYSARSSTCIVKATSTTLGFQFKQYGGSSSWMTPITIHIIMQPAKTVLFACSTEIEVRTEPAYPWNTDLYYTFPSTPALIAGISIEAADNRMHWTFVFKDGQLVQNFGNYAPSVSFDTTTNTLRLNNGISSSTFTMYIAY